MSLAQFIRHVADFTGALGDLVEKVEKAVPADTQPVRVAWGQILDLLDEVKADVGYSASS